ncbi:MAG TPA: hypothetical protein VJK03_03615 [Candidatus Nanoarchaeia archaeon]|nr:hypothetical protein [Candidatus Nanoarchaeia archaeon]
MKLSDYNVRSKRTLQGIVVRLTDNFKWSEAARLSGSILIRQIDLELFLKKRIGATLRTAFRQAEISDYGQLVRYVAENIGVGHAPKDMVKYAFMEMNNIGEKAAQAAARHFKARGLDSYIDVTLSD